MKLILLIAFIILAIASSKVIEIKKSRYPGNVLSETLALELDYYGSCQEFKDRVLPTVWVSKYKTCLPIQVNVTWNPDYNDLNAHFFCSNVDEHRSRINFVEIYAPTGSPTQEETQYPDFVVSLIPSAPLRVMTRHVSLARRPNCWVTNDYCEEGKNAVVNRCEDNFVVYRRRNGDVVERPQEDGQRPGPGQEGPGGRPGQEGGFPGFQGKRGRQVSEFDFENHHDRDDDLFVASHDRIYFSGNKEWSLECKSSEKVCCPYIKPTIFGGICDHDAHKELNDFWREPHHDDDDGHRHHDEEEHRHHDEEEHRHHHHNDEDDEEKKRSN